LNLDFTWLAMIDTLFEKLDLNRDGKVSRIELHHAAARMGWDWSEAPLFAVLDLFSVNGPISETQFAEMMQLILADPMGVYGRVLRRSPHFFPSVRSKHCESADESIKRHPGETVRSPESRHKPLSPGAIFNILERHVSANAAMAFQRMQASLGQKHIPKDEAALLIIDPQLSFIRGAWMQSMGARGWGEVAPIRLAFKNCARLLRKHYGQIEAMFTRCPFPPGSYDWDERLSSILDRRQLYFIKPGNSVLFPPNNGFREWLHSCIENGQRFLIIGGCTLNSCVRVSALEIRRWLKDKPLQVVVDISLSGARAGNFRPGEQYGGLSPVESAIRQMEAAGVSVVRHVQLQ
jgi:hypothetical protein